MHRAERAIAGVVASPVRLVAWALGQTSIHVAARVAPAAGVLVVIGYVVAVATEFTDRFFGHGIDVHAVLLLLFRSIVGGVIAAITVVLLPHDIRVVERWWSTPSTAVPTELGLLRTFWRLNLTIRLASLVGWGTWSVPLWIFTTVIAAAVWYDGQKPRPSLAARTRRWWSEHAARGWAWGT